MNRRAFLKGLAVAHVAAVVPAAVTAREIIHGAPVHDPRIGVVGEIGPEVVNLPETAGYVTLRWDAVDGADLYRVVVHHKGGKSTIWTTSTIYRFAAKQHEYYFTKVRALLHNGRERTATITDWDWVARPSGGLAA